MRILVVIPCLNEQQALPALLGQLGVAAGASRHQLVPLVIDDGSPDSTAAVARGLGVRVVRLRSNLGIGGAVQTGLRVAHEEQFDAAVQLDGDGQHPAEEIDALLAPLFAAEEPHDLVIGSRYLGNGPFRSTFLRRAGKAWLSIVLRAVYQVWVTDPTSGFRAFGPRALRLFQAQFPYDFPEPESVALCRLAGLRVSEVAATMRARQGGESSISGLAPIWYVLKVTAAVLLSGLRGARQRARMEALCRTSSPPIGSLPSSVSPARSRSSG